MFHALTLVSPTGIEVLASARRAAIDVLNEEPASEMVLSKGKALDMAFSVAGSETKWAALGQALSTLPVDFAWQPALNRRKKLLIADMDSTIIGQECLDELAVLAGVGDAVAAITERAMAGELDFEGALKERVAMIAGLPLSMLQRCYSDIITLNPGAKTLLATMKAHGAYAALVSGGFTFFTSRVAAAAGFDENRANTLLDDGSALTGHVGMPILGRAAKAETMADLLRKHGLSAADALAVGDGANDLAMIEAAGLGVAFHAKPIVAARANARVTTGDLTSLLYFQGYLELDFISA
jgi:phosphoserine phosphatase